MTPSPGTIRRNASTISARRRRTALSGGGSSIKALRAIWRGSALARLIPRIGLIDDKDAPLAPYDAAVLVAFLQRLQRIDDLHAHVPREGRNIGRGCDEVKSWARIECVLSVQA